MTFCELCHQRVDPDNRNTYQRVSGWERHRDAGGTNAIALREVEQRFSHRHCVDLVKRGISPMQGTLI